MLSEVKDEHCCMRAWKCRPQCIMRTLARDAAEADIISENLPFSRPLLLLAQLSVISLKEETDQH